MTNVIRRHNPRPVTPAALVFDGLTGRTTTLLRSATPGVMVAVWRAAQHTRYRQGAPVRSVAEQMERMLAFGDAIRHTERTGITCAPGDVTRRVDFTRFYMNRWVRGVDEP